MNMVSPISYYFANNINENINSLAIYNDNSKFVSLRSTGKGVDVTRLAQLCDGGGHKSAAGCKYDKLIELLPNVFSDENVIYKNPSLSQ